LNNGANAGLACENGNNTPGNANWNSRPRLIFMKADESLLMCACISVRKQKSVKPESSKGEHAAVGCACGK